MVLALLVVWSVVEVARQKKEKMITLTRHINELWRCSSIDINMNE